MPWFQSIEYTIHGQQHTLYRAAHADDGLRIDVAAAAHHDGPPSGIEVLAQLGLESAQLRRGPARGHVTDAHGRAAQNVKQ